MTAIDLGTLAESSSRSAENDRETKKLKKICFLLLLFEVFPALCYELCAKVCIMFKFALDPIRVGNFDVLLYSLPRV